MKRLTVLLTVVALAVAAPSYAETKATGTTTTATATADKSGATIAILDVNKILSESKAAKGLNDQMNSLRVKVEQTIMKKEEELRSKEKELEKLTGDKLEKARTALEAQVAEFQKTIMSQQNDLQQAAQQAMDKIRDKVIAISGEVANGKGFAYVQPAAGFLYYPTNTDITTETIAKLDKDLPSVKVEVKATA